MAKKKKREIKPWCWYCEREFEDIKILLDHQKAKHFKCNHCTKKLSTAGGLVIHLENVHREVCNQIMNALPGRESVLVEIFGMEGVPFEDIEKHRLQKEEQWGRGQKRAKTVDTDPDLIKAQFLKYQEKAAGMISAAPNVFNFNNDKQDHLPTGIQLPPVPIGVPGIGLPLPPTFINQAPPPPLFPGMPAPPTFFVPGAMPGSMPLPSGMLPPPPPSFAGLPPPPMFAPPGSSASTSAVNSPMISKVSILPANNHPLISSSLLTVGNAKPVALAKSPFAKFNDDGTVLVYGDEEFSMEERRALLPMYKVSV